MFISVQSRARQLWWLVLFMVGGLAAPAYALQGALGIHDPSTIVKSGNTYWVFGTGDGIACKYSTDLINWTDARSVYTRTAYPGWINSKVPAFAGNFWAPECKLLNGKYYLYYSCSTFGSQTSAIGLTINTTLDPADPNYKWVDQGEVVSTNGSSAANSIDPALFQDANSNLWLTYGSYFGGIRITQLDATTGKPLNLSSQYAVANGDVEASYVAYNGGYYYLFVNRGTCCQGVSSTYHILVGRATSPGGPYLDQSGTDLNAGGGTLLLGSAGRFVGPGHTGIFTENGTTFFSHHYYDGYDSGTPKLGLARLTWGPTGWPAVSRDWVAPGRYTVATAPGAAGLGWQSQGCTGASGQGITQGTRAGNTCQQWDFTALGNGDYKIASALGGLAASVAGCADANSALLQLGAYTGAACQQFHLDQAGDGSLVFASVNGNRVVEVPFASATAGTQLGLFDYNGCTCQHWYLAPAATPTAARTGTGLDGVRVYPVPAPQGRFTVALPGPAGAPATVEVFDLAGRALFRQAYGAQQTELAVAAGLAPGLYLVRVRRGAGVLTQKLTVL